MRIILMLPLLSGLIMQACGQQETLLVGKGGGIAGIVIQYKLTQKGKVYKGTGMAEINYSSVGKIKRSEARKLFKEMERLTDTAFHHPGNIYYFIEKYGENDTTRYTWGDIDFETPESLGAIYKNTMMLITDIEYKTIK